MNTSRYILLLSIMMLLPLFAVGQRLKPVTKREAEQLGKKTYVVSSGKVTKVVNTVGSGLEDEYSEFLFRKLHDSEADSIFSEITTSYDNLEEAALDLDKLLRAVELEQKVNKGSNDGLGFWISQRNRERRKREIEAKEIAENYLKEEKSVKELTAIYLRYGNKPSYYINGVEVDETIPGKLYPGEIIKREMRASETASGNPNGEIWYTVTDKALSRIKVPGESTYNYMYENSPIARTNDLSTYLEEKERERKKAELKPQPVVRRAKTAEGKYIDIVMPAYEEGETNQQTTNSDGTRILSRSINNKEVDANKELPENMKSKPVQTILPLPVIEEETPAAIKTTNTTAPQRRAPIPVVRKDNSSSENTYESDSQKKEEDTPKRSVRKIKEKEKSQYENK